MYIYFVRHGHPDYKTDTLTALGHKQAEAAAERLKDCGIEKIFSSAKGRAMQTAEHTAEKLGLDYTPCSFINEIGWKSLDGEPIPADGHPWQLSDLLVSEGTSIVDKEWREEYPFNNSRMVECCNNVAVGIDQWLEELGYKREGLYYRVMREDTYKTVAMFSHAGASSAALAHMLNIPFPQICGMFNVDFTAVTVIKLSNRVGEMICPKIMLFNDAKHIEGVTVDNVYGN